MARKGMWVKVRKPISPYPETPQQRKVKIGGLLIRRLCKGKKGKEFSECRSQVLACAFDDKECDGMMKMAKLEVIKEELG